MHTREQGLVRSGLIISLLIAAAVIILFLLPTPKSGKPAKAATTQTTTATPSDCLQTPVDFSSPAVLSSAAPASLWKGWTYNSPISLSAEALY